MRHLIALLILCGAAAAQPSPSAPGGTAVIYETDGVTQTGRPITMGRIFGQGEFPKCVQPLVNGAVVASYQCDVKNRWPDGSARFAILSFIAPAFDAGGSLSVTFQSNASCNNTGFLTQRQMMNFNTGGGGAGWGADMQVTAASQTVTTSAATLLASSDPASNTFNDCKNDYWLKGPVVTMVLVQECTATSTTDFGFEFTKANPPVMTQNAGAPFKSLHPWFLLAFYPGQNYNPETSTCSGSDRTCAVKIDYILENDYPERAQDQVINVVWRSGGAPAAKLTRNCGRVLADVAITAGSNTVTSASASWTAGDVGCPIYITGGIASGQDLATVIKSVTNGTKIQVVQPAGRTASNALTYVNDLYSMSRWRKTFWSGTGPGNILIDHKWRYLISTKAFPYYDLSRSVDPAGSGDFGNFMSGDRGDLGGGGTADGPKSSWGGVFNARQFSANNEGAPMQREELLYLYNMGTCGVKNGKCAKAWYMLTGQAGDRDSGMLHGQPYALAGGGGQWNAWSNVTFHYRESRALPSAFFCPGYDKNAVPTTPCGATKPGAVGKPLSRHADPSGTFTGDILPDGLTAVGTRTAGAWTIGDCSHWLNFSYTPYLLLGDPFYLEEAYMSASFCLASLSANPGGGESHGFYGYINPSPIQSRWWAWGLQEMGRAAAIAPDGTAEQSYYTNMLNSNLEVQEGFMNKTGTTLTPTVADASGFATNTACANFDYMKANRWNWGWCTLQAQCYLSGGSTGNCAPNFPPITPTLHMMTTGACTTAGGGYVDTTKTSSVEGLWLEWYIGIVLSHLNELGFTQASTLATEVYKLLIEMVNNGNLDSNGNPYLIAMYNSGTKAGAATACAYGQIVDRHPYFADWPAWRAALVPGAHNINTFNHGGAHPDPPHSNFPCTDHGYQLLARAVSTYFGNVSSTDHACTGGTCSGAAAQGWLLKNTPYFDNRPADGRSSGCGAQDAQIRYALAVRPGGVAASTTAPALPPEAGTLNTANALKSETLNEAGGGATLVGGNLKE